MSNWGLAKRIQAGDDALLLGISSQRVQQIISQGLRCIHESNLSPEKEQRLRAAAKNLSRDKKVSLMVEYLGYSSALAEWMVDNDPDHDYSKLLLLEQLESA